jgi:hypothetical protein
LEILPAGVKRFFVQIKLTKFIASGSARRILGVLALGGSAIYRINTVINEARITVAVPEMNGACVDQVLQATDFGLQECIVSLIFSQTDRI